MPSDRLIVFDYSGTLSLAAPRFAWPDNLVRTLAETGLADLGVATPEVFWNEIVGPTWVAGSTTQAGYGKVMAERIAALRPTPAAEQERIGTAAARFVAAYLKESPIDPRWRPLLHRLAGEGSSRQVIATDHYAEATAAIVGHLQALDIQATALSWTGGTSAPPPVAGSAEQPVPLRKGPPDRPPTFRSASPPGDTGFPSIRPDRRPAAGGENRFFVANSADLGVWKSDRRFWETLKAQLPGAPSRGVLMLDDFGLNEEQGDTYGEVQKAASRQQETLAVLRAVFGTPVEIFPFVLQGQAGRKGAAGRELIAAAAERIERFLD
jgi:hypothetical protein